MIWLPRGLTRDYDTFGTRGHVDIVATFASPGRRAAPRPARRRPPRPRGPAEIAGAALPRCPGRPFEIVAFPAPRTLEDDEGLVDYSYINHFLVNDGVVACTFDDPQDADAVAVLATGLPRSPGGRVDARPLFDRGGGIHCITQQQPSA